MQLWFLGRCQTGKSCPYGHPRLERNRIVFLRYFRLGLLLQSQSLLSVSRHRPATPHHNHDRIQALHEPRSSCHSLALPALKKKSYHKAHGKGDSLPLFSTETTEADRSALATMSTPCCDPLAYDCSYFAGLVSARGCSETDPLLRSQTVCPALQSLSAPHQDLWAVQNCFIDI